MAVDKQVTANLVTILRKCYPNWINFSDPSFSKDEIDYKKVASLKSKDILSEQELKGLILKKDFKNFIERLFSVAKLTNLLWLKVPLKGDLRILYNHKNYYVENSDFCNAIFDLLYGTGRSEERLDRYIHFIESKHMPNSWTFPTYFLFLTHPDTDIFVKPSTVRWLIQFAGLSNEFVLDSVPSGRAYAVIKQLYHSLKDELNEFGPKDMIDMQSFVWVCADTARKSRHMPPNQIITTPENGLIRHIRSILDRKGQVILYGPPGTGKTYWAEKAACELAAQSKFGREFMALSNDEKSMIIGGGHSLVRICCFHPAYGYEDFIEGYWPENNNGKLRYALRDGVFKSLCQDAHENPEVKFYLIVDEINRGDVPRIFGELMTALEKDKRNTPIMLPLSGDYLEIPENAYLIGTMNTADRSISLIDTALRRRFGFIELMPDISILKDATIKGINLGEWLELLNQRLCDSLGQDARNLQVGHSYLLEEDGTPISDISKFAQVLQEDIIPLLEEYCYEDYYKLEKILGKALVDADNQEIRRDLLKSCYSGALTSALIESSNANLEKGS